jgi:hypothetical protein
VASKVCGPVKVGFCNSKQANVKIFEDRNYVDAI